MGMRCFCAQAQKQVDKCEIYLAISSCSWKHVQLRDIVGINFMPTLEYTCKVIQISISLVHHIIRIYQLLYRGHKFSDPTVYNITVINGHDIPQSQKRTVEYCNINICGNLLFYSFMTASNTKICFHIIKFSV